MGNDITEFINKLYFAGHKLTQIRNLPITFSNGITLLYSQVTFLNIIGSGENVTTKDIMANIHITKGAVSQTITKLDNMGLLKRVTNSKNAKSFFLELTEKGQEIYDEQKALKITMKDGISKISKDFTDEEKQIILRFLESTIQFSDSYIDAISSREKNGNDTQ